MYNVSNEPPQHILVGGGGRIGAHFSLPGLGATSTVNSIANFSLGILLPSKRQYASVVCMGLLHL